jgi:hypothetical protein
MSFSPELNGYWYLTGYNNNPTILKKSSCNPNSANCSRNLRISKIITNTGSKGRIQYGNTYMLAFAGFGLNYLGRSEGMPGGSGTAFKNKF